MLAPLYTPFPLHVRRAEGVWLHCDEGDYFDTFSGIGVLTLGHSHPAVTRAIEAKLKRHAHLSNFFTDEDATLLAQELIAQDGRTGSVIFTNSGAEANEAALKAVAAAPGDGVIAAFEGDFHGRTVGSLALTWGEKLRGPFETLLPPVVFLPRRAEALRELRQNKAIKALWFEAVQGSGGVIPLPDDLADELKAAQKDGALLVADEVQCGLGRCGVPFAYQLWGLTPDLVALAKGLGGGLPLGALLSFGRQFLAPGSHGSTFAPNPLAAAAGRAVLSHLTDDFLADARRKGAILAEGLKRCSWCSGVRGRGLMIAAETQDPQALKAEGFKRGVLLNVAGGALRFLPALTITDEELGILLDRLTF